WTGLLRRPRQNGNRRRREAADDRGRLQVRGVDLYRGVLIESGAADVSYYADDFAPVGRIVEGDLQPFADRVRSGKVAIDQGLIDHRDQRRVRRIAIGDGAAAQQAHAHRLEESRSHCEVIGEWGLRHRNRRTAFETHDVN